MSELAMASPINSSSCVLVVGASQGLGLGFVRACLALGARVVATERTHTAELHVPNDKLRTVTLDVADRASVKAFGTLVSDEVYTHVIHNAGVFGSRSSMTSVSRADMEQVYRVNVVGMMHTLQEVFPMLKTGGVWAVVSSRMGSVSLNSGGAYPYRASKAAVNIIAKGVAAEYGPRVAVVVLHPGYVATKMTDYYGPVSVEDSVAGMLRAVQNTVADRNARFISYTGEEVPW